MAAPAAPGGPTFPVASAEALAAMLRAVASDLEDAARLRVEARDSVPEFQGRHADTYRADVGGYGLRVEAYCDEIRRTAGRLTDALEEYQHLRSRWIEIGQPI
jgi:hypothetical protein